MADQQDTALVLGKAAAWGCFFTFMVPVLCWIVFGIAAVIYMGGYWVWERICH